MSWIIWYHLNMEDQPDTIDMLGMIIAVDIAVAL